jgi:hypothetical protein
VDPTAVVLAYLDDITVDCTLPSEHVEALWQEAVDAADEPLGMELNIAKTVTKSWEEIAKGSGIELLGSFVGPLQPTVSFLKQKVQWHMEHLAKLSFASTDTQVRIFSVCVNNELVFTVRNTHTNFITTKEITQILTDIDTNRTAMYLKWIDTDSLPASLKKVLHLPKRTGGGGLTSYSDIAIHAAEAAVESAVAELHKRRIRHCPSFDPNAKLTSQKSRCKTMYTEQVNTLLTPGKLSPFQHRLWSINKTREAKTVYFHHSRWVPHLSDAAWLCELRHRVLLPDSHPCARCEKDIAKDGHAPRCMSEVRQPRHDQLRDAICSILSSKYEVNKEVPVCVSLNANLRADFKVHKQGDVAAAHTIRYYDLTIVEQQCATALADFLKSDQESPPDVQATVKAANQLAQLTLRKYSEKLVKYNSEVVPLVATADGYLEKQFSIFLASLDPTSRTRIRCAIAKFLLNFRAFRFNSLSPPSL